MADEHDLGSCAARREGSSPSFPTIAPCPCGSCILYDIARWHGWTTGETHPQAFGPLCLLVVVFLSACDDDSGSTITQAPIETPTPVSTYTPVPPRPPPRRVLHPYAGSHGHPNSNQYPQPSPTGTPIPTRKTPIPTSTPTPVPTGTPTPTSTSTRHPNFVQFPYAGS